MFFLPGSALAKVNILYTFDNGKGADFVFDNTTGLFTLDDTHGELRLAKPADTSSNTLRLGRVRAIFRLIGNFDVSVDYKINQPLNDGDQLEFQLYSKNFNYFISRSNEAWLGGNNYHVFLLNAKAGVVTEDTHGTLRFVRQEKVITVYFKSPENSEYTFLDSRILDTNSVLLGMVLQSQPNSHAALDASYDNLSISADGRFFRGSFLSGLFPFLLSD
jgi:hypothetical protein